MRCSAIDDIFGQCARDEHPSYQAHEVDGQRWFTLDDDDAVRFNVSAVKIVKPFISDYMDEGFQYGW